MTRTRFSWFCKDTSSDLNTQQTTHNTQPNKKKRKEKREKRKRKRKRKRKKKERQFCAQATTGYLLYIVCNPIGMKKTQKQQNEQKEQ